MNQYPYQEYHLAGCHYTGFTAYTFYRGDTRIGTGSADVIPSWPVHIQWNGRNLYSEWDIDNTLFPGVGRQVVDRSTSALFAQVLYQGRGKHSLKLGEQTIQVLQKGDSSHFYLNNRILAVLARVANPVPPPDCDEATLYCMTAAPGIPEALALLMLSFPLLRISI